MKPPVRAPRSRSGFTLLEIMIVLAIGVVLVGLSVPYITGLLGETQLREPARELQDLAKTMRSRAMTERVSYEIVFTADGFFGRRSLLYAPETKDGLPAEDSSPPSEAAGDDGESAGALGAAPSGEDGDGAMPASLKSASGEGEGGDEAIGGDALTSGNIDVSALEGEIFGEYRFKRGTVSRLLFWGNSLWMEPGEQSEQGSEPEAKVSSAWVFSPSGLCNPLRVEFRTGEAWIEMRFNPLTADLQEERYRFPD